MSILVLIPSGKGKYSKRYQGYDDQEIFFTFSSISYDLLFLEHQYVGSQS
jgi:hypothetical protein